MTGWKPMTRMFPIPSREAFESRVLSLWAHERADRRRHMRIRREALEPLLRGTIMAQSTRIRECLWWKGSPLRASARCCRLGQRLVQRL
jgi:hypothetical protein